MFSAVSPSADDVARCVDTPRSATRNACRGTIVGYARAHRDAAALGAQLEALGRLGAVRLYRDDAKGAAAIRPGLDAALGALSPGDCLAVVSLDRLAWREADLRAVIAAVAARHGHLWSIAEDFDTRSSSDIFSLVRAFDAFAEGVRVAREAEADRRGADNRLRISPEAWAEADSKLENGELTTAQAAKALGVARSTVWRRQQSVAAS